MRSLVIVAAVAGFVTNAHAGKGTGGNGSSCSNGTAQSGLVADQAADFTLTFGTSCGPTGTEFGGFNSALGTLTSVSLSFAVNGSVTGAPTSASSVLTLGDAGGPSAVPAALLNAMTALTLTYTPSTTGTVTAMETATITDPTLLDAFEIPGLAFSLDLITSTSFGQPDAADTSGSSVISEGGNVSIVYNYALVPEPATIAAFAAGLAALTFVRRRKRA
jgi:hypothetical protein